MRGEERPGERLWGVWRLALGWRRLALAAATSGALLVSGLLFDAVRGEAAQARLGGEPRGVGAFELVSLAFLDREGAGLARAPSGVLLAPEAWGALFVQSPVTAGVLLLMLGCIGGAGVTACARSSALVVAGDVVEPPVRSAAFAAVRGGSVTSGLAFVMVGVACGLPLGEGGGLVVALAVAAAWALLAAGWMIACGGFACEASDGMDAQHRTLAYIVARPLGACLVVLVVWGEMAVCVAAVLALGRLGGLTGLAIDWGVRFAALTIVIAFAGAGGAVGYLVLRHQADGQRVGDVWTADGVASGTFSRGPMP